MKTLTLTNEEIRIINHALLSHKLSIKGDSDISKELRRMISETELAIYSQANPMELADEN